MNLRLTFSAVAAGLHKDTHQMELHKLDSNARKLITTKVVVIKLQSRPQI
jgi:hypothetical protein